MTKLCQKPTCCGLFGRFLARYRRYRMASPRHRDETNAAYAHSAENDGVSYGVALTNFDGVDGTFK